MDKPPRSASGTCSGEPPVGCNGTEPCLKDTKVKKKTGKKKIIIKRWNSYQRMNTRKTRVLSPTTLSASSCHQEKIQSTQQASALSTCDQSTQTETPQPCSFQAQSTQTPPIQHIHSPSTEYKSTQTQQSSFSLQLAYWGRSCIEQSDATDEQKTPSSSTNSHLTVICWNIDGLDTENTYDRLKDNSESSEDGYFTGILLKKNRVQFLQSSIVKYPTTDMGRNLLITNVSFFGHPLSIMTSHLESNKSNSQERLNQLRRVWKWMKDAPEDHTVIFGGDTNLRDWEVKKLGGLPDGIADVWEMLGKPEESRYTWDTSINDNKEIPDPIRLRFDRLFLRVAAKGAQLQPESMTLIGLEKLQCDYFISDHWGILCTFAFGGSEEE